MKLHTNVYRVNKEASLEEGSMRYETTGKDSNINDDHKGNRCDRCLQFIKVILYLELIFFIGWIGCVFITNYYQIPRHNGSDQSYSSSERTQDPDGLDSSMDMNPILRDAIKWSLDQEDTKTTVVKSGMSRDSVKEQKNVISEIEAESMLLSSWLESLTNPKNSWDENSSKLTSSKHNFDWDASSNENQAFNPHLDEASLSEHHFGTIDQDHEIDLNYILTLPIWRDVVLTSDYVDEIANSDKDIEDGITNTRLIFTSPNSIERNQLRGERSIIGQEEDNSSSSSSEESTTIQSESNHSNTTNSDEEKCPTILDDAGNVIDKPKDVVNYIGKNWVRWFAMTDIPECEKPKVVKSVTVDKCGKFVINCALDASSNRDRRSVEVNDTTEEKCKQLVAASQKDFEAWRTKLVKGEPSDPMVQNIYSEVGRHVIALILPSIVQRLNGGQQKTDEQWLNAALTIKSNISELIDSGHKHLLAADNELTLQTGAELRKLVDTVVDIYMNCADVLMSPPQARLLTMLIEREKCLQGFERMMKMENTFAAEIVPGESTNSNVMAVRGKFKRNILSLIIRIARDERQDPSTTPTGPVNVTNEQWTSYMLGLKQEIAKFPEDPALRQQLENAVSPTQEQTNQLREIAEYYLRQYIQCTMLTFFGLMEALRDVESFNNQTASPVGTHLLL